LKLAFPDAFSTLDTDEIPPCAYNQSGCTREIFLGYVASRRPVYLPNTTPGYSNAAFAILGLVLESMTGKSYAGNLRDLLSVPLGLQATTESRPRNSTSGVIVVNEDSVGWNLVLDGAGTGMGAIFSTANDMTKIGRTILASSLLPDNTTRAWFKPTSHTSSLIGAVGWAWEIFRTTIGPPEHNRIVDLYTKAGNVAGYGANYVLIPDHSVGFVVLTAGTRGRVPYAVSSIIVDQLLPALDEAARVEAASAFAGTYTATGGLNSTLVLSSAPDVLGLSVGKWISNGTDILAEVVGVPTAFENYQMYPTNIISQDETRFSWRVTPYSSAPGSGLFSACPSWAALDRPQYGVYGLDEFVFHTDHDGKATAVEPKALKIVLERV
jgi:hypothetical protein